MLTDIHALQENTHLAGIIENPVDNIIAQSRAIVSFTIEYLQPSKSELESLDKLQNNLEFFISLYQEGGSHE